MELENPQACRMPYAGDRVLPESLNSGRVRVNRAVERYLKCVKDSRGSWNLTASL